MGGYGSGRRGWASTKETVESCLVLSAAGLYGAGTVEWRSSSTGEPTASIDYYVNTFSGKPPTIRLQYTTTRRGEDHGEHLDYPVRLTTTPLPWGWVRWWFLCPLTAGDVKCGRRVGKLYLPPGGRYFGCRHCYDLTYESTRRPALPEGLRMLGMTAAECRRWACKQLRKLERERNEV